MPFILPTLLSFKGSTHLLDVGSFSNKTISVDTISRLCELKELDLVTFKNCTFDEGALTDFKLKGSDTPELHFIDCKGLDDLGFFIQSCCI